MSIRRGEFGGAVRVRVTWWGECVRTTENLPKEAGTTDRSAASVDVICFYVFQMKTGSMTVDTTAGCTTTSELNRHLLHKLRRVLAYKTKQSF
jgi:hypothetical protein